MIRFTVGFIGDWHLHIRFIFGKTKSEKGGLNMKEDEKKPITWEAADPKLPVVQSGHMENRKRN
jgi:hypothetical protein